MIDLDRHSEVDLLGREGFANNIAENLVKSFKSGSDSLVIGIEGKWGAGKTTFTGFIKKGIEEYQKETEDSQYIIIDFNPWMYSGQDDLQRKFFTQMFSGIGDSNEFFRKVFKKIGGIVDKANKVPTGSSEAAVATSLAKMIFDFLAEEGSLKRMKAEFESSLLEKGYKVFVFIDDLDRLNRDEIAEVLQLVKLNASIKNVFYVLSYDRDFVDKALVAKYGDGANKFIEKIVQVDYSLPEILPEKIEEIFFQELSRFIQEYNLDFVPRDLSDAWKYRGLRDVMYTVRDIKRYFNALRLRLPTIYKNVHVIDFMVLEAIRVFDRVSYNRILQYFSAHPFDKGKSLLQSEIKSKVSNMAVGRMLEYLSLSNAYRYEFTYYSDKRLTDPKYTANYFSLSIPSTNIDETELETFLKDTSARESILESSVAHMRINSLLQALSNPNIFKQYKNVSVSGVFTQLLRFVSNRELLVDELSNNLYSVMLNLCNNSVNERELYQEVCHELSNRSNRNLCKFILTKWLLQDVASVQGKTRFSSIGIAVINQSLPSIKDDFENSVRDSGGYWVNHLRDAKRSDKVLLSAIFTYSFMFPKEYFHQLNERILAANDVKLGLLRTLVTPRDDEADFEFNSTYNVHLFPSNTFQDYYKSVENISPDILDEYDRKMVSFFLKKVNPQSFATESTVEDTA